MCPKFESIRLTLIRAFLHVQPYLFRIVFLNLGHVQYNGAEGKIQSQIQLLAIIFRSDLPIII